MISQLLLAIAINAAPTKMPPVAARGDEILSFLGRSWLGASLADVATKLGSAPEVFNGLDAGAAATNKCYIGKDGTVVVFSSNSEMGSDVSVTSFQLAKSMSYASFGDTETGTKEKRRPKCRVSRLVSRRLRVANRIRLGESRLAVIEKFGPPSLNQSEALEYEYEDAAAPRLSLVADFDLVGDKVISITVSFIESD